MLVYLLALIPISQGYPRYHKGVANQVDSGIVPLRLSDVDTVTGEVKVMGKGSKERVVMVTNNRVRQHLCRFIRGRKKSESPNAALFKN